MISLHPQLFKKHMPSPVICGAVRCEVTQSLREENVRKRFYDLWDVMMNIRTDGKLW